MSIFNLIMSQAHHFWDERYSDNAYVYGTSPNEYFKQKLDAIPSPGKLLLLAEGEGRNAVYAAQNGWQVTAVDFSAIGREKALRLAEEQGVEIDYQLADIQQFDMAKNGPWDAIGLIYAHQPAVIRTAVHQKCIQALRPGGLIILEAFNKNQIGRSSGGPKDPESLYSQNELEKDFEGLEMLEAGEYSCYLNEGPGHEGQAEIVRLLLKK